MESAEALRVGLLDVMSESPDKVNEDKSLPESSELAEIVEVWRLNVEDVDQGINEKKSQENALLQCFVL